MSIASNVIEINSRLATARTNLRNKLTQGGVDYKLTDDLFELLKRWPLTYLRGSGYYYNDAELSPGNTTNIVQYLNGDVADVPVDFEVNGVRTTIYTNEDGDAIFPLTLPDTPGTVNIKVYIKSQSTPDNQIDLDVKYFYFYDYWCSDTDKWEIVKYPSDLAINLSTYQWDGSWNDRGMKITKTITSSSCGLLIPNAIPSAGIDASKTGIKFTAKICPQSGSNSGFACGIALVNSKSLSHYRDTKILELGSYAGKKGLKYSNTDHVERDLNVTSGQLNLNSTWYTFELYYDNGYIEAYIKNGSTTVYSYSGTISDKITLDKFYPAMMVYDYGGQMIFNDILMEPWSSD